MSSIADGFGQVDISTAEIDALEARHAPLTDQLRRLVDVAIRTRADGAQVESAVDALRAVADQLESTAEPGPAGVRFNAEGRAWNWGNAAVGVRNAVAPPMTTVHGDDGVVRAALHLGAAYEGPPHHVHGGVSALLLDHLMGETASGFTRLTVTGTLSMRYVRPLPLGPVELQGRIVDDDGRKVRVHASIGAAGETDPAVEADGLFIVPRDAGPVSAW